jgi:hypothetical protein
MLKAISVFPLFVIILAAASPLHAAEEGSTKMNPIRIPDFSTTSEKEADEATTQVVKSYDQIVVELMSQIQKEKATREGLVYCVYLLGEFRALRAVSLLVDHIDLEATRIDPKLRKGRWGVYPAEEALVKIGDHSVREVLAKLAAEENKRRRVRMAREGRPQDGRR